MSLVASAGEIGYVTAGIQQDLRADGRARVDFRHFALETEVLPQANGSARVRMAAGGTDVLAAVKAEIGEPEPDRPDRGRIAITVDVEGCSSAVTPAVLGGETTESARGVQETNAALTTVLENARLDLTCLGIVPGRYCWVLHVDVLVIHADGNLHDAIALAAHAALRSARYPALQFVAGSAAEGDEDDFEIDQESPPARLPDAVLDAIPVTVTLSQIGGQFVVDATFLEEQCASARLTVGINRRGNVCGLQQGGGGAGTGLAATAAGLGPGLETTAMFAMLQAARVTAGKIFEQLDAVMQREAEEAASAGGHYLDTKAGLGADRF